MRGRRSAPRGGGTVRELAALLRDRAVQRLEIHRVVGVRLGCAQRKGARVAVEAEEMVRSFGRELIADQAVVSEQELKARRGRAVLPDRVRTLVALAQVQVDGVDDRSAL